MPSKVFITGVTGYIGGDLLFALSSAQPDYEITALVRDSDQGAKVAKAYASVRLVYGDLDATDVLEQQAREADVVCHLANADHQQGVRAIVRGLAGKTEPGYLIHTSGAGILYYEDVDRRTLGEGSKKVWDDVADVTELTTNIPDHAFHRVTDKIVQAAAKEHGIKTAIVAPPTIYGVGRGPGKQRSHQIPELIRATLQAGYGLQTGEGQAMSSQIHVHDLSALFVKLVGLAVSGADQNADVPTWGEEGYYFCESGEFTWAQVAKWVVEEAGTAGLLTSNEVRSLSIDEADQASEGGSVAWGANARARASRARQALGWKPSAASIREEIPEAVRIEAKALGLVKGHRAEAAGE